MGDPVTRGNRRDGFLRGVDCAQLAVCRVQPHRLEVVSAGEVEVLPEGTLECPDPDACRAAEILEVNGLAIALLEELLNPLGDEPASPLARVTVRCADSVDEEPELRCRGKSRRLSGCEMLDPSCSAALGTVVAFLQLEHEGVVGA